MRPEWYELLKGVHYLGYHTEKTMSYDYDEARDFTLATTNESEIKEIRDLLKRGGMKAVVWVVEGRESTDGYTDYSLREVFHPTHVRKAIRDDTLGARKKFEYIVEGDGQTFGEGIFLNNHVWFYDFLDANGNFGFGLDNLRDDTAKTCFLDIARPFYILK